MLKDQRSRRFPLSHHRILVYVAMSVGDLYVMAVGIFGKVAFVDVYGSLCLPLEHFVPKKDDHYRGSRFEK